MSDPDYTVPPVPTVDVSELIPRLDRGDDVVILDVRNDEEFKDWKLEALRPIETVHVPYFDFIEDAEASMARVPRDHEIIVLCAQGGSSEMIVDMLQEAGVPSKNVKGGMVSYGESLFPLKVPLAASDAGRFEIWQINRRGKGCLSYTITSGGEAVVVDATRNVGWYEQFAREIDVRIVRVLDTHIHADHISGGPALAARLGAPYSVNAGPDFELRQRVAPLTDGQILRIGGAEGVTIEVRIIRTPGHTPGSTSYLIGGAYLLTGDTIFVTSVGRPDLGGHVVEWGQMLFDTLRRKMASLPDEIVVLPAHYAGVQEMRDDGLVIGRLGHLRESVPELQIMSEDEFVEAVRAAVKDPPPAYAEIIKVNLGLQDAAAEKLTEWELGKNQCAAAVKKAIGH
jgi:glyoxylase-like metal-dependent hydrolase (beta-lactamase superfamily II)/rhodanese-related sulfurtransferase